MGVALGTARNIRGSEGILRNIVLVVRRAAAARAFVRLAKRTWTGEESTDILTYLLVRAFPFNSGLIDVISSPRSRYFRDVVKVVRVFFCRGNHA